MRVNKHLSRLGRARSTADIGYVLQLEVLEHGIDQHSAARKVSDEQREREIRAVFRGIPMGVVYVVMAHTKHIGADPKNVFFHKVGEEYEVLPHRLSAWQDRIGQVRDTLMELVSDSKEMTRFI